MQDQWLCIGGQVHSLAKHIALGGGQCIPGVVGGQTRAGLLAHGNPSVMDTCEHDAIHRTPFHTLPAPVPSSMPETLFTVPGFRAWEMFSNPALLAHSSSWFLREVDSDSPGC